MSMKTLIPELIRARSDQSRLHDVIRIYQSKVLADKYSMYELTVMRPKERTSKSFEDQVLASPDYHTFLLDSGSEYIEWAIKNDYGVIDANVPQHVTGLDDQNFDVQVHAQQLCCYLWDNYVGITDAKRVIIIGIGRAAGGVTHLLGVRADCRTLVAGVCCFYGDVDLRAVIPPVQGDGLVEWYHENSLVYCSHDHNVWQQKKLRKKYGGLRRAESQCIADMLREEYNSVTMWLEEKIKNCSP